MRSIFEDVVIDSVAQLKEWVSEWGLALETPHIVLLEGDLGAGKTELTRALLELWGSDEVHSPTYSVINEYPLKKGVCFHIDLYRLEDMDDLLSTGFWDLFEEISAIVVIEWADRLNYSDLPHDWPKLLVKIDRVGEGRRIRVGALP